MAHEHAGGAQGDCADVRGRLRGSRAAWLSAYLALGFRVWGLGLRIWGLGFRGLLCEHHV